jgi:hypothetical protein
VNRPRRHGDQNLTVHSSVVPTLFAKDAKGWATPPWIVTAYDPYSIFYPSGYWIVPTVTEASEIVAYLR